LTKDELLLCLYPTCDKIFYQPIYFIGYGMLYHAVSIIGPTKR